MRFSIAYHNAHELPPGSTLAQQLLSILLAALMVCAPLQAQQPSNAAAPSDLASQNYNRVAASAPEIRKVLEKEPGLMLELKRWLAGSPRWSS